MESKEINPRIWKGNAEFLKDSKYYVKDNIHYKFQPVGNTEQLVDNNESITPTTDKGYLDFNLVFEKLGELTKIEDKTDEIKNVTEFAEAEAIFIKKYQYKDIENSDVVRFGINTNKKELGAELSNYNETIRESLSGGFLEKMSNISGETNYGKFINAITPTGIEKDIVNNAIQYLNHTGNKTVLVDVFPRVLKETTDNKVGTIDLTKGIENHAVLLYKTLANKILIIDPNNPQFSAFLKNVSPDIISSYRVDDKIYTRAGNSGPEAWRDCIDIAVKLAFVLNNSQTNYLDIPSIIKSPEVKLITNNPIIDDNIFYSKIFPVREKQKSDLKKIIDFHQKLEVTNDNYKNEKIKKYSALQENIKILENNYETEMKSLEENFLVELSGDTDS